MDQSKLARAVGVEPQTIQYLVTKGKKSGYTNAIATVLAVDPTWLSTGKGDPIPSNECQHIRINAELLEDIADLVDIELAEKNVRLSKTMRFHWIADIYEEAITLLPEYTSAEKAKIVPLFKNNAHAN